MSSSKFPPRIWIRPFGVMNSYKYPQGMAYHLVKPSEYTGPEYVHLEEFQALQEKLKKAREALAFYSDGKHWHSRSNEWKQFACIDDADTEYRPNNEMMIKYGGKKAREALKKIAD